jgi:DNA-binding protein
MGGNPAGENSVYIGKRPTMNYVMAIMMVLNDGKECIVKARGRAISHAVDVCEILKNRFMKDVKYRLITISTEKLTGNDGKESNVSAMEIKLSKF